MRRHRSTILLATPTFLAAYARRAKPEDFASLRLVVAGAEKLRPASFLNRDEFLDASPQRLVIGTGLPEKVGAFLRRQLERPME